MSQKITLNKQHENLNPLHAFAKGKKNQRLKGSQELAVLYSRVSSSKQFEENHSLETQKKYGLEYASKNDINIIGYFGGTYESATTDERKEFQRMLKYITDQKKRGVNISIVLVYNLDRFSRNEYATATSAELRKNGVRIVSVTQQIDTTTDEGVVFESITFAFNKYDNDKRKMRCNHGMQEKLRRGEWLGCVPVGYKYDHSGGRKEQKIVFSEHSLLIKKAFQWKAQGVSNTSIQHRLAKLGLKLPRTRFTDMFKNPFYAGFLSHKQLCGEIVKGKHEPLITEELFLKVNHVASKTPQGHKHQKENENIPLKQFLKCSSCGSNFAGYIVKKKNLYYYKCSKIGCKCNRSAKQLHSNFESLLNEYTISPKFSEPIRQQLIYTYYNLTETNTDEVKLYKGRISELKGKLDKVEERFAFGEIDRDIYEKVAGKLRVENAEIEAQMEKTLVNLSNPEELIEFTVDLSTKLATVWASSDFSQKQALQKVIFPEGIHYDRENDGFRTFSVNPVFQLIATLAKSCEGGKIEQVGQIADLSPLVARRGIELQ